MMRSFVLRVAAEELAERRVVGRVEVVETGETARLRSADDLLDFLWAQTGGDSHQPPSRLSAESTVIPP